MRGSIRFCFLAMLAWFLIVPGGVASGAEDRQVPLQKAIDEYSSAMDMKDRESRLLKFGRAEQLFRQVIEENRGSSAVRNADLYVNLGNAALQAERIGPAIVAYRKALRLEPQHAQARQNLAYARSLLPDWIRRDEPNQLIDSLFFWHAMMTRGELLVYGALCFLVASVLLGAGIATKKTLVRNLAFLPFAVWGVLTLSLLFDPGNSFEQDIVVTNETMVYTADSENSAPRLAKPLPSGAEAHLIEQRTRWSEIELSDGRTGWMLNSAIDRISE